MPWRTDTTRPNLTEDVRKVFGWTAQKPKMFMASSTRAKPLVSALKSKLETKVIALPWFEMFESSKREIMPSLIQQCGESDFAAVFLTQDDVRTKAGKTTSVPRDNCILELGLFMGGLGLEPRRLFILTSLNNESLPTDLIGHFVIPISERAKMSRSLCAKSVAEAAEKISQVVDEMGYCFARPSGPEMERPHSAGGRLLDYDAEVLVYSRPEIELNQRLARTVCENLRSNVSYRYFFKADIGSIRFFSSLVRALAAASQLPAPTREPINSGHWIDVMCRHKQLVEKALNTMRTHLRIYLLPGEPPLEFRVHNANDSHKAICYLSYWDNSRVEWCRGEGVKNIANKFKSKCYSDEGRVFQGSKGFELYSDGKKNFLTRLVDMTVRQFPERPLRELVREICFGY